MSIRKATILDAEAIQSLIFIAVDPENNADFDEQGIEVFKKPNQIGAIKRRISNPEFLTLCFIIKNRIIGIITIYKNEKLDQLFVDPEFRNKQISKQLWLAAKEICSNKRGSGQYWVKSSTMAIPVYQSFGFQIEGTRQKENGIVYYTMLFEQE